MPKRKPKYRRGPYKPRRKRVPVPMELKTTDLLGRRLYMRTYMAMRRSERRVRSYSPRSTRHPMPPSLVDITKQINDDLKRLLKAKKKVIL